MRCHQQAVVIVKVKAVGVVEVVGLDARAYTCPLLNST